MTKPKGMAVCIGLNAVDANHYGGWSGDLNACEADAEDMIALAKDRGFDTHSLLTTHATRKAVYAALTKAAGALDAGDMLFLTYSGHGGQVPDRNGDEPDFKDETWCLYDGELLDDELYALWRKFKAGVRILVLSDSCHSGSVVREYLALATAHADTPRPLGDGGNKEVRIRAMPDDVALRTYRRNKAFYDKIGSEVEGEKGKPILASVRLISGCQDNQLSSDGSFNGLFTGTLLRVWNQGAFKGDYTAFHRAIVRRMPPTQTPNHYKIGVHDTAYDGQKPFTL